MTKRESLKGEEKSSSKSRDSCPRDFSPGVIKADVACLHDSLIAKEAHDPGDKGGGREMLVLM